MKPGDLRNFLQRPHPVEKQLRQLIGKDRECVIFDIGACEGEDSVRYAALFPRSRIVAFEPLAANLECMRENLRRYGIGQVELHPVAVSDREGTAEFHVSAGDPPELFSGADWNYGNKSSSLLPPISEKPLYGWIRFPRTERVTTTTLDQAWRSAGAPIVDLIHLDVQGAESAVLAGGKRALEKTRALWVELAHIPQYQGQLPAEKLTRTLNSLGFTMVSEIRTGPEGDALFINRNLEANSGFLRAERWARSSRRWNRELTDLARKLLRRWGWVVFRTNHPYLRQLEHPIFTAFDFALCRAFREIEGRTFLQIGAHDGVRNDPLHPMISRWNWQGTRVEPNPVYFRELMSNTPQTIRLIQAAVGFEAGRVPLFSIDPTQPGLPDWAGGLATLDRHRIETARRELGLPAAAVRQEEVQVLTWNQLLEQLESPEIEILVTDLEGLDVPLLQQWDWQRHLPRVVLFEHGCADDKQRLALYGKLIDLGYEIATQGPDTVAYQPQPTP